MYRGVSCIDIDIGPGLCRGPASMPEIGAFGCEAKANGGLWLSEKVERGAESARSKGTRNPACAGALEIDLLSVWSDLGEGMVMRHQQGYLSTRGRVGRRAKDVRRSQSAHDPATHTWVKASSRLNAGSKQAWTPDSDSNQIWAQLKLDLWSSWSTASMISARARMSEGNRVECEDVPYCESCMTSS
jgi:hypothetical protein